MYSPYVASCAGEGAGFEGKPTCLSVSVSLPVKSKRKDGDVVVLFTDQISDQKQVICFVLDRGTSFMSDFHSYQGASRLALVKHPSILGHFTPPCMDLTPPPPSALDMRTLEDVHWVLGTNLLA